MNRDMSKLRAQGGVQVDCDEAGGNKMTEHVWHVEPVGPIVDDDFVCVDEQQRHTRKHFHGRACAQQYADELNALRKGA